MGQSIALFSVKIKTWSLPIIIRAYDVPNAEMLTRILFDIPTGVEIKVTPKVANEA